MNKSTTNDVISITLRAYQAEADAAAWEAYTSGAGRALVVMATGLGKTFTAAWFTRRWLRENPGKRATFLVDSVDATKQGRKEFAKMLGEEFSTGIRCGRTRQNLDANVLFSTLDSMAGLLKRKKIHPDEFGLVIIDESHHARAETYEAVITAFEDAFFYAMTATPNRADGRDIRDLFGEEVYSFPLVKALADGEWLAPVTYKVMHDNMNVDELMQLIRRVQEGDRTVTRAAINKTLFLESEIEEVVRHVHEHQAPETQTIVFCSSIDHALEASSLLEGAEPYYSGLDFSNGRQNPLVEFRAGRLRTIVVVDKLNEAVDVPEADLLVFWRSTETYRIWAQQLGRGLRKAEGKSGVTVLDFVANCERVQQLHEMRNSMRSQFSTGGGSTREREEVDIEFIGTDSFQISFTQELVDLIGLLEGVKRDFYETIEEAMQALECLQQKPKTQTEYKERYKQDSRLHSNPSELYENKGWVDWATFLGTKKYSYQEAKEAVQRLSPIPTTGPEYEAVREQDPKLPAQPLKYYKYYGTWVSMDDFLGIRVYTFEEAQEALQNLVPVPKTRDEYWEVCHQDPLLPRTPQTKYNNGRWKGWPHFLLGKLKPYETYEEARNAVRRLPQVPTNGPEYRELYCQDPRLPKPPDYYYKGKGWQGWTHFLKHTYSEARLAVQRLDPVPTSGNEYRKVCQQDPFLPRTAQKVYKGKGWIDWDHFLGKVK